MNKLIRIYTIPQCTYCTELKELLNEANIEFTNVDVSLPENQDEYNKVFTKSNSDEVPIIMVGNQLLVPNVSFSTIKEAYLLTKKFIS